MKDIDEIVKQAEEKAQAEVKAVLDQRAQERARIEAEKAEVISFVKELVLKDIDTNDVTLKILDRDGIRHDPIIEVFVFNKYYKWPVVAKVERMKREVSFTNPLLSNNDNIGIDLGNGIYCERGLYSRKFNYYVDALAYCIQSVEPVYQSMVVPGDESGDDEENYAPPIPQEYSGEELVSELTRIARQNDDETAVHALVAIGLMSILQELNETVQELKTQMWASGGEG